MSIHLTQVPVYYKVHHDSDSDVEPEQNRWRAALLKKLEVAAFWLLAVYFCTNVFFGFLIQRELHLKELECKKPVIVKKFFYKAKKRR